MGTVVDQLVLETKSRVPHPTGIRFHYGDGSKDFFSYKIERGAIPIMLRLIERRLLGSAKAAEIRYSDGSLVVVRPKGAGR